MMTLCPLHFLLQIIVWHEKIETNLPWNGDTQSKEGRLTAGD